MSIHEVESLFDVLRWFGLLKPWFSFDELFHEIPHSCLEYGTGVTGRNKDFVKLIYGQVVHGSPKPSW